MADSHHRGRNRLFILAFTVIIALQIGEGIDQGFDFWDWLVIGVSAAFIIQAVSRLRRPEQDSNLRPTP